MKKTETITITRALAELKLLDLRITKALGKAQFIDLFQNRLDKCLKSGVKKSDFEKQSKAHLDSVTDLIDRRNAVKAAVLTSNSITKVKIKGVEYTVVEAIDRKTSIDYDKKLLHHMTSQYSNLTTEIDRHNTQLDTNVMEMVKTNLGTDKAVDSNEVEAIQKPFLDANRLNMIDPIHIKNRIETLEESIDDFLSEVDFVLSESNARTEVEIKA